MQTLKQRARSLVFSLKRSATLANGPFTTSKGTGGGRSRVEEAERRGSKLEREGKRWRNTYIYVYIHKYVYRRTHAGRERNRLSINARIVPEQSYAKG